VLEENLNGVMNGNGVVGGGKDRKTSGRVKPKAEGKKPDKETKKQGGRTGPGNGTAV